jgi:hypothetical protein
MGRQFRDIGWLGIQAGASQTDFSYKLDREEIAAVALRLSNKASTIAGY